VAFGRIGDLEKEKELRQEGSREAANFFHMQNPQQVKGRPRDASPGVWVIERLSKLKNDSSIFTRASLGGGEIGGKRGCGGKERASGASLRDGGS